MKINNRENMQDRAKSILNNTTMFVDLEVLSDVSYYIQNNMRAYQSDYDSLFGNTKITDDVSLIKRLLNLGIPKSLLTNQRTETLTKAAPYLNAALESPSLDNDQKDVIRLLKFMTRKNSELSNLKQYLRLPIANEVSYEGHSMAIARPTYGLLSTQRFGASDPSLQNLVREYQAIITVPKGMVPVISDSSQVEPMIIYNWKINDQAIVNLIKLYDDAYYALYHYCMYGDELVKKDIPVEERKAIKLLSNQANYGSESMGGSKIATMFNKKVTNHPLRLKWEADVTKSVDMGVPIFENYFGIPVYPEKNKTKYTSLKYSKNPREIEAYRKHLIRCGINNPIQSTAAFLMNQSVCRGYDLIEAPGIGTLGYYKHDESFWGIDEDMVDIYAPMVRDLMSYEVDDWAKINSDLVIGRKELKIDVRSVEQIFDQHKGEDSSLEITDDDTVDEDI